MTTAVNLRVSRQSALHEKAKAINTKCYKTNNQDTSVKVVNIRL